ncbi:hypothetical protein [Streptomyces sp.]|uniref:hypothetical protein n=1 Tax=Streptomyces sp. TaxID=1931 RepID=UPI002D794CEE|nr:hypothetical protein [Streptomyces sp.]HET6357934.1 hypothetical protein [Streptomyces sp.]
MGHQVFQRVVEALGFLGGRAAKGTVDGLLEEVAGCLADQFGCAADDGVCGGGAEGNGEKDVSVGGGIVGEDVEGRLLLEAVVGAAQGPVGILRLRYGHQAGADTVGGERRAA